MINSQNRSIVIIICSSDIVLAGLAEILKASIANEIISLHLVDEMIDYPKMDGNILVITTSDEYEKSNSFIRQILFSASQLGFLTLHMDTLSDYSNQTINLSDTTALVCYKVNEVLTSFLATSARELGTELTKREIEVLQLLTKGYANKEIADQLFVSIHTVISHRKNITEKTGIKSASGLTMYAILKKIIDVGDINQDDLI